MREAVFIPETKNIEDLLHYMKKTKFHLAIVADEYGGFSGLVSMEDIIEEIVGEIFDEFDVESQPDFVELTPDMYLVDGGMNIDDLAEKLETTFPSEEDYDSIGGFVLSQLGKFPKKGEKLSYQNLTITVKEIRKRRIVQLEIKKTPVATAEGKMLH
jgi:putative hemolysin